MIRMLIFESYRVGIKFCILYFVLRAAQPDTNTSQGRFYDTSKLVPPCGRCTFFLQAIIFGAQRHWCTKVFCCAPKLVPPCRFGAQRHQCAPIGAAVHILFPSKNKFASTEFFFGTQKHHNIIEATITSHCIYQLIQNQIPILAMDKQYHLHLNHHLDRYVYHCSL